MLRIARKSDVAGRYERNRVLGRAGEELYKLEALLDAPAKFRLVVVHHAFPADLGDLPADQMQEIRDIGFTHYRRAEGDLIAAMAILRAACLILCALHDGVDYA